MPKAEEARGGDGKYIRSPETAQRDARCAELRAKGWAYRAIAAELDMHPASVHEAVQRALRAIVQEPAEEVRQIELDRLDAMYAAAMRVLEKQHVTVSHGRVVVLGDEPLEDDGPVLQAIDRLLRIQERRAKLLGLDSATKTEVSGGVRYEIIGVDPDTLT